MDYLTTLSVAQAVKCSVVEQLTNEELEIMSKIAFMTRSFA